MSRQMKCRRINRYRKISKTTNLPVTVHVMEVFQATAEQLADFQTTMGDRFKVNPDTGLPIIFSASFEGTIAEVVKAMEYVTNPVTKVRELKPTYKVMAGEDLELKRSVIEDNTRMSSDSAPMIATAATSQEATSGISDDDASF